MVKLSRADRGSEDDLILSCHDVQQIWPPIPIGSPPPTARLSTLSELLLARVTVLRAPRLFVSPSHQGFWLRWRMSGKDIYLLKHPTCKYEAYSLP